MKSNLNINILIGNAIARKLWLEDVITFSEMREIEKKNFEIFQN